MRVTGSCWTFWTLPLPAHSVDGAVRAFFKRLIIMSSGFSCCVIIFPEPIIYFLIFLFFPVSSKGQIWPCVLQAGLKLVVLLFLCPKELGLQLCVNELFHLAVWNSLYKLAGLKCRDLPVSASMPSLHLAFIRSASFSLHTHLTRDYQRVVSTLQMNSKRQGEAALLPYPALQNRGWGRHSLETILLATMLC